MERTNEPGITEKGTVYNSTTGKEMQRTVHVTRVFPDGFRLGYIVLGRTRKPVYYSNITYRWCIA
ncbi:hypothetical protein EPA93_19200 [Ktedonosporobacter rubrisoli]|uniref:Uncharacterized protein n=1 Tax=Ktedonosporobacter rubrisoli TaxID=2509675 RepID=A0A4P6JRC6_KTERU|nr:hypothetical protein [Ktedonosporobacter rubrisoli]QBD78007.1 hypothetical protein EPA93_19200 [Ktedonosporobacter rubrisoli]